MYLYVLKIRACAYVYIIFSLFVVANRALENNISTIKFKTAMHITGLLTEDFTINGILTGLARKHVGIAALVNTRNFYPSRVLKSATNFISFV